MADREKERQRLEAGRLLTQLLVQRLQAIQADLGEERVGLSTQPGDGNFYTMMLSLTPHKAGTAAVEAYVHERDPSTVYLGLGESTWVEVFGPKTPEALVGRIAELAGFVRQGRFREKIWKRHGKVTDTHGRIQMPNGKWRLIGRVNRPIFNWGYDVEYREYLPWD